MFFYDPMYMVIMLIGSVLVFLPQLWVKNTVKKHHETLTAQGMRGCDIANRILADNGLHHVSVELSQGELSDHYDPSVKAVRLSPEIYQGRSVSSAAIAAHECGHAIQHAKGYYPVVVRSAMVPAVNLGSNLGPLLLMAALFLGASSQVMPDWAWLLAWAGVALYGMAVAFHFVTLPVEFDASFRAMKILKTSHYLNKNELSGAQSVLTAAACTYMASALYALMQLLYYVMRIMGSSRSND
ncbi:MAG: zinc metallopeptidase [Cyanobacteria bacterium P01_H01_bin.74]